MIEKKKILLGLAGAAAAVLVFLLVLWIITKIRERNFSAGGTTATSATSASSSTSSDVDNVTGKLWAFPLQWGSGSHYSKKVELNKKYVKNLQTICNHYGCGLAVDGIWGNKTEAAVAKMKNLQLWATSRLMVEPFAQYISPVASPLNSTSKLQITSVSDYNGIVRWYNSHRDEYKTSQQMFGE